MGLSHVGGTEQANRVATGTITTSQVTPGVQVSGDFNVSVSGSFTGSIAAERSFDGGSTWLPMSYVDGSAITWIAQFSTILNEPEAGVYFRLNGANIASGSPSWRISL